MVNDRERGHAAIVHIWRGQARVAQARDFEFRQIRGVMREPHAADVGVLRVEAIVFKGIFGEVEAAMAAETIGLLTEKTASFRAFQHTKAPLCILDWHIDHKDCCRSTGCVRRC